MGDWSTDAPGVRRLITTADLPKPYATPSVDNGPRMVARPENAWPKPPEGFKVEVFASGLNTPRKIITAPNGDIFVADGYGGHKVHRFSPDAELLLSWGRQGTGPGEFALVHNVWVDRHGRVFI